MDEWNQNDEEIRIQAASEMSPIVLDKNQMDFMETEGIGAMCGEMGRSVPMAWTDEKHSSYLSSMEAAFVEQLRNQEHPPMHFHTRLTGRKQKVVDSYAVPSNGNTHFLSCQFKVHCRGCWKKLSFGRACCQPEIENESRVLLENPWIQRFRSGSTTRGTEATSPIPEEDRGLLGDAIDLGGQSCGSSTRGTATNSRQFLPSLDDIYGSNAEMSDQNFEDRRMGAIGQSEK